ncbi:MAG: hypothetical protein ACI8P9_003476 [Parasphingorhabdus sp.]|jgi:hypothetical protein
MDLIAVTAEQADYDATTSAMVTTSRLTELRPRQLIPILKCWTPNVIYFWHNVITPKRVMSI